jgi:ABC-type phosphate transport system permease subunit
LQKNALDDQAMRNDTIIDRIFIQRKIWITNIVKTLRLILQMLFVAFIVGQFFFILSESIKIFQNFVSDSEKVDTSATKDQK